MTAMEGKAAAAHEMLAPVSPPFVRGWDKNGENALHPVLVLGCRAYIPFDSCHILRRIKNMICLYSTHRRSKMSIGNRAAQAPDPFHPRPSISPCPRPPVDRRICRDIEYSSQAPSWKGETNMETPLFRMQVPSFRPVS